MHRHLSSQHPLNELLKYHCRGLLATNTLGSPSLVNEGGYMDILTAIGHKGTILLLERGYKTLGWKDTDFHQDIKVANKIIFAFSEKERKNRINSLSIRGVRRLGLNYREINFKKTFTGISLGVKFLFGIYSSWEYKRHTIIA